MDEMQANLREVEATIAQNDAALAAQIEVLTARITAVESALASVAPATTVFEINADGNLSGVRLTGTPAASSRRYG